VSSQKRFEGAAEQLAAIFEGHSAKLQPEEREIKTRAFDRAVAKIDSRAKLAVPAAPRGRRRAVRLP
jgi:hypothetical protein